MSDSFVAHVPILTGQADFLEDRESALVALIGGYGSGKSRALAYKLLDLASLNGKAPTLFIAPTYKLIKDNTFRVLREAWEGAGLSEGADWTMVQLQFN